MAEVHERPASLKPDDLKNFSALPAARQAMLRQALALTDQGTWLKYVDGSADPAAGGFDCSGAMVFIMKNAGLTPPRSSADLFKWLEKEGRLHRVANTAKTLDDPSLAELRPGDLLFWAVGDRIHHVAMFLGFEMRDGHAVALHSTDGRSYRGVKANGYGVYDFKIPAAESASKFVGYGTAPGIPLMKEKLP